MIHREDLINLIDDLKTFYADQFSGGNMREAVYSLEQFNSDMRRKDAISISFWSGASIIMLSFGTFFLCIKSSDGDNDYSELVTSINILRLTLVIIYILFCTACAIKVFLKYGVNYLYIFELDPNNKMTSDQLFKVSSILIFFWGLCFTLTVAEIRLEFIFHDFPAYPVVAMFIFFTIYCM